MPSESAEAHHDLVSAVAKIVVSATFTADPLVELIDLFMRETGLDLGVVLAPYGQVFQELLDRTRLFSGNRDGVNVVLVRFEDWLRDENGGTRLREDRGRAESLMGDLVAALQAAARAIPAPLVVCVCPSALAGAADPEMRAFLASLESGLADGVAGFPSIHLLSKDRLGAVDSAAIYDAEADRIGHLPYTPAFFASLGTALARLVHALKSPPHKVLVLDCDNTLWKGAVGEDGIRGIEIAPQHRALQTFALSKKSSGMVLCLASKNVESDVTEVFRKREEMILREEDLASMRVNWLPKSDNLKSLAAELNLGLDSFVLIDDNPVECAEVEANCPGVLVIRLPVERDFASFLGNVWPLDLLQVTEEDRRRTEAYRQNRERTRLQASATNFADFLEGLELRIEIAAPRPEHHARLAQLTQRTNQFNLSTRRRTEGQMAQLASEGKECRIVEVKDRFGDYGLVGLIVFGVEGSTLVVDTMLLSCRALGRGVEHAMIRELGAIAMTRGLSWIEAPFVPTSKNLPARIFLDGLEAVSRQDSEQGTRYRLAADRAAVTVYAPGEVPVSAQNDNAVRSIEKPSGNARSARWNRIARDFDTPAKVLSILESARKRRRSLGEAPTPPRTETERRLVRIWADELHLAEIGVRDDYFDLGGTSIAAVAIFARIERELGPRIPLASLMECKTVEGLAARIDRADEVGSLVSLTRGGPGLPLFLVHDADGETLLYRNLARRLPGRPVYGIQPHARGGLPILETRIEQMVSHYVSEIRKVQPHGPYLLGGLCAGGVLAFEMARQLELANEEARLVAVFDAADVGARLRPHLESTRRLARVREALEAQPLVKMPGLLMSKATGFVRYQLERLVRRGYDRLSFVALRRHLDRGGPVPAWVKKVSVRTVYSNAEAEYRNRHVLREGIVLFRATQGIGLEEPYAQIYQDPLLGWGSRSTKGVTAIDVPGGHGSMLQEPNVEVLANALRPLLDEVARTIEPSRRSASVG